MSERGVFAVDRGIWSDPDFAPEPFTEREAWMWLVGAAAWKASKTRGNAGQVELQRGEFSFSVRFLADKWRWETTRVHRFLKALEKRNTVCNTARNGCAVYSIKNYNRFQKVGLPRATKVATPDATQMQRERNKEESIKTENIAPLPPDGGEETGAMNGHPKPEVPSPSQIQAQFARFRAAYPERSGAQDWKLAGERFARAMKSGASPAAIIAGASAYGSDMLAQGKVKTEFVRRAAVFLSQETWREYADSGAPPPPIEVTDETWSNRLETARGKRKWSIERWGPMPGQLGSLVPPHLLRPGDGTGWQPWEAR